MGRICVWSESVSGPSLVFGPNCRITYISFSVNFSIFFVEKKGNFLHWEISFYNFRNMFCKFSLNGFLSSGLIPRRFQFGANILSHFNVFVIEPKTRVLIIDFVNSNRIFATFTVKSFWVEIDNNFTTLTSLKVMCFIWKDLINNLVNLVWKSSRLLVNFFPYSLFYCKADLFICASGIKHRFLRNVCKLWKFPSKTIVFSEFPMGSYPHKGNTELFTYPWNYVYIWYVWSNYGK